MSTCACTSAGMTAIAFANGTVLLRCLSHDMHRWIVGGTTADVADALRGLGELFTEHRGAKRRPPATPAPVAGTARRRVIALDRPSQGNAAAMLGAGAGAQLTALLHARGLQGSWAVA